MVSSPLLPRVTLIFYSSHRALEPLDPLAHTPLSLPERWPHSNAHTQLPGWTSGRLSWSFPVIGDRHCERNAHGLFMQAPETPWVPKSPTSAANTASP